MQGRKAIPNSQVCGSYDFGEKKEMSRAQLKHKTNFNANSRQIVFIFMSMIMFDKELVVT